jgi:hypothetical protein
MDLNAAATFFDDDPFLDGYSGAALFSAQAASFDDSSSDGATNRRRVLSTGPDVVMPARRVVQLHGDRWLVGTGTPDGFLGEVIRRHYTMKRVTDLMALLTPGQTLAQAAGTPVYVQKMYFKDTVNQLTDSEYDTQWNIFVAPDEVASQGSFFRDAAGRLYRVRNDYLPTEGLRICQSDALDVSSFQECVFDTRVEDPVTETMTGAFTTVNGIVVDLPKFYRFQHVSDAKILPGDTAVFVPANLAVTQGMTFTIAGKVWRVMALQAEIDAKVVHARRA